MEINQSRQQFLLMIIEIGIFAIRYSLALFFIWKYIYVYILSPVPHSRTKLSGKV
jgi:hypothetical protein